MTLSLLQTIAKFPSQGTNRLLQKRDRQRTSFLIPFFLNFQDRNSLHYAAREFYV
jgi:hypothetical protein